MARGRKASSTRTPSTPSSATGSGFHSSLTPPQSQSRSRSRSRSRPQPQSNTQINNVEVEPVPFSIAVADHDVLAIINAYKDEPGNPMYAFKHFLFSVTEPQLRVKPAGVSDILWAEAMGKLEDMERADGERLWPQLVQGFKDLTQRLMIQEEVIVSDAQRLRVIQTNVKLFQRHFQTDILPGIQRMKQKEQILQRRLLTAMRTVEALAGKGCRIPLTEGESELAHKLATISQQLKGPGVDLRKKVRNLLTVFRAKTNSKGFGGSVDLPRSIKIHEKSLSDLQEVLQKQMECIARLASVVKRDMRDLEIVMAKGHKKN